VNRTLFDFEILTHLCDVSAARGHEDNRGSKVLTEHTYQTLMAIQDLIRFLADHDEREALHHYLLKRARWLGLEEQAPDTLILAKFGAMMRLFTPEDGRALQRGYQELSQEQRQKIYEELNPLVYRKEKTPTYIPAVFVNFVDTLVKQGSSREQALTFCLLKAATFVADCLKKCRTRGLTLEKTINFNRVAGQARDNPDFFLSTKPHFKVNEEGMVELY
jgi:hypothetical protein